VPIGSETQDWYRTELTLTKRVVNNSLLRSGEVRAPRWRDVFWDDRHAGLYIGQSVKNNQSIGDPKNCKSRVAILNARGTRLLNEWMEISPHDGINDLIIYGDKPGKPLTRKTLSDRTAKVLVDLKIQTEGRDLKLHSLRHSFVTRMRRRLPQETL